MTQTEQTATQSMDTQHADTHEADTHKADTHEADTHKADTHEADTHDFRPQDFQTRAGKYTLTMLVENKPGVLNRVVSLFRRRAFNVDSLTVGRTQKPYISRMTIVVDGERVNPYRMASNLEKLIDVIDVQVLNNVPHVARDLVLVKVRTDDAHSNNTVTTICERYPARLIDIGPKVSIIELTSTEEIIEKFVAELQPIGIVEMMRTGVVAMGRGTRVQDTEYEPVFARNGAESFVSIV